MASLTAVQEEADKLSPSERQKLICHLIEPIPSPSLEISDEEADLRDAEIDSGKVSAIDHEQFVKEVRG